MPKQAVAFNSRFIQRGATGEALPVVDVQPDSPAARKDLAEIIGDLGWRA